MNKDYYSVLGVDKNASENEIKSSYRKLAREWHPDVAKNKPNAEKKFKEINEAYQVLKDKNKRAQYDQFGTAGFDGGNANSYSGFNSQGGFGPFKWSYTTSQNANPFADSDPFDIFEQVFGFGGRKTRGRDYSYVLSIDFEDSIKGIKQDIKVNNQKLTINIPAGIKNGTKIKFSGKGESLKNHQPGDLYITVDIKSSNEFSVRNSNIYSESKINVSQAVLGDTINVKTIDPDSTTGYTSIKMKVPAGTQPNTIFKLKKRGMPNIHNKSRGDHFVTILVEIPKKVSKQQKKLFEELF